MGGKPDSFFFWVCLARGVSPVRLTAIGYGETSPRATNVTERGRRLNRRVDIMLRARAR